MEDLLRCGLLFFGLIYFLFGSGFCTKNSRNVAGQCGTMQRLEERLSRNPALRSGFLEERESFNGMLTAKASQNRNAGDNRTTVYIPVVFHVVLSNPAVVTNAQLHAQLDT